MTLSHQECHLIKNSWKLLQAKAGVSNQLFFYQSFFQVAPEAEEYFHKGRSKKVDLKLLTQKFNYTIAFIVDNVENLKEIPDQIADLGRLHNKHEIPNIYYTLFNESFLKLIDQYLDSDNIEEVKAAWKKVLDYLAEKMQLAPPRKENKFHALLNKLFGPH